MSELTNIDNNRVAIRRKLLAGTSALALAAYISMIDVARAADASRPEFWIELDGQFAQQESNVTPFAPQFLFTSPFDAASHLDLEQARSAVWNRGAKVSFQPEGSDWILSVGFRYGNTSKSETRTGHPTRTNLTKYNSGNHGHGGYNAFQIFSAQNRESHAILDFQAAKDVGIGRFRTGASSVFSAGLRIAQFDARNQVDIKSQPTNANRYFGYDRFYASLAAKRKFEGIGPSLSWDASATILGNPAGGGISLDWGVNGAVLFGRQRSSLHPRVIEYPFQPDNNFPPSPPGTAIYHHATPIDRDRNVAVPNFGGFAGLSWRYPNAKVSLGYRADFFFGAMDGGIDAAHRENVGFYGPFASVSVGIGG